ncbi:MAG: hypothetical protein AUK03_06045 [Anaerolineae bacterium CG2_30_64_16]|nr:MAG: hypothetical protein AUK03_06045 [Anaerolineae bacterium CG2_30_64_16]
MRFGSKAGLLDNQRSDPAQSLAHSIVLTGLQPSTTYAYRVRSTDATGNAASSREAFFKTVAASPSSPSLSEFTITRVPGLRGLYRLSAAIPNTAKIVRVDFYLDGKPLGQDYAPLPDGGLNRFEYLLAPSFAGLPDADFFRQHTIEAVAVGEDGLTGRGQVLFDPPFECAEIEASVVQPLRGKTLFIQGEVVPQGTTQHIEVSARRIAPLCEYPAGDTRSAIERMNCIEEHAMVASVDIYAGGRFVCHLDGNNSHTYECDWDLGGLATGTYTVRADVTGDASCKQTVTQDLSIRQGEARLDVTREVTRAGNVFEVALTVENVGRAAYTVDRIEDSVTGFQPIAKEITDVGLAYTVAMDCRSSGTDCALDIEVGDAADTVITLHPGGRLTVSYQALPVLDVDPDDDDWVIGTDPVRVVGRGEQENPAFDLPCVQTTDREPLADAVRSAWGGSNYLIVTNRGVLWLLYGLDTPRGYHSLLSDMARLARYRGAMLGYVGGLDANDPDEIREVIRDWGSDMRGADMAAGGYLTDGYLLIVGDSVVVASKLIYDDDIADATADWQDGGISPIRLVDNYYANTSGSSKPELAVGRLPGDTISALRRPIETSLLDLHNCSWGLVVSGTDDDDDENEGDFREGSRQIRNRLDDEFEFVRLIHWDDFPSGLDRLNEFLQWAPQMDAIFYQDHGGVRSWDSTLETSTVPNNFQGSYPVVVALACWTGHYQAEDSIAEAFLDSEAGAYIGSTEPSAIVTNVEAGPMYVERWLAGRTAAQALRQTKRALWGDDPEDVERMWVHEYNYYGDPTYAYCPDNNAAQMSGLAAAPDPPVVAAVPPSTLTLMIPPYEVSSEGGIDRVSIPGGGMLLTEGQPMVPTFLMTQEIPAGYQVQDVTLAERSGLSTASGLVLPIVRHEPANSSVVWANQPAITANSGWYPERDFGWQIDERPDGATTLVLRLYPFYYNAATRDARFYTNYRFSLRYTQPDVRLTDIATDKLAYAPGEPVEVHLIIESTGAARDAVVAAVVRREASSEPVAGLLLTTMAALEGRATFSTTWSGGDPDAYYAEITLREPGGDLINRATAAFVVGSSAAEISSFTATPASYAPGQPVAIHLSFANTGSVPIAGAATVEVRDPAGGVVQTFTHDFEGLAVGASLGFDDVWTTTGMLGTHRLLGYVTYDGQATEPAVALVRSSPRTYLLLVLIDL